MFYLGSDNSSNRVLSRKYTGNSKNDPRDDSTHGHNQTVNTQIRLNRLFVAEDGEDLYRGKARPGADFSSDHQLLIIKLRLKLKKKVGKITRLFGYDLNQIPYDYIVEVINRFK